MGRISRSEFDKKIAIMREDNERMKILHEIKEERELYSSKTKQKQMRVSTIYLIASIVAVVLYTMVVLIIQACTGTEVSTTLTERWYTFWTIEITALTGIKVTKVIKDYKSDKNSDNDVVG